MIPDAILSGTRLPVSRLCLGTARLGVDQTEAEAHALLDTFVDLGGRFFDTARVYSDWIPGEAGRSERILGDWLRARPGLETRLVVATKGLHADWSDRDRSRVTPEAARQDLEASLRALGLESIDLYWLHRDDPLVPAEEIIEFMQTFVREGKVRYLGAANWELPRLIAANAYAERKGLHPFVASQPLYNLATWNLGPKSDPTLVDLTPAAWQHHAATGLALIPYSPQAQGFFTHAAEGPTTDSRNRLRRYCTPANFHLAGAVAELARTKECTPNAIGLAWLLHQPMNVFPVIGPRDRGQLVDSAAACSVRVSEAELEALRQAGASSLSTHPSLATA